MRNYIASSLVIFLFVRSSLSVISVAPFVNVDIKEKSCCPLEWVSQGQKYLKYAIKIETTDGGVYLAKNEDESFDFVDKDRIEWHRGRRSYGRRYPQILSNTRNCSLLWLDGLADLTELRASELLIPTLDGKSISISKQEKFYNDSKVALQSKLIAEYLDTYQSQTTKSADLCSDEESHFICKTKNRSILHIDCIASMKNNLVIKLESIVLNSSLIHENSLASNYSHENIINHSNRSISGVYYSEANFPISLWMNKFYGYYNPLESKERFLDAFEDKTDLSRFLSGYLERELESVWESPLFQKKFGQIHRRYGSSFERRDISKLTLKEAIEVAPLTKCHYATSVKKFIIESPVTVTLAIVPRTEFWKHEDILRSFRVLNISTDKLRLVDLSYPRYYDEGKRLIFWYEGTINIGGYYGANMVHSCEKMTPDGSEHN